jgi:palmitoyltransferase ZDHHC9/14/18
MQVFFLDGRVICGPDPRGLILTTIAVLLSEWIFLVDVVDPSSKHPILIAAFSLALAATVSDTMLCYFMDHL